MRSKQRTRSLAVRLAGSAVLLLLLMLAAANARAGGFCHNPVNPCDPHDPTSWCYIPPDPSARCEPYVCSKCTKSPCHVGSGVYMAETNDLSIRTIGLPILVNRLYQSTHVIDGEIGPGWVSGLSARLYYAVNQKAPPNSLVGDTMEAEIRLPNGKLHRFAENLDGTFSPPPGRFDRLAHNADNSWDLWLQRSNTRLHFSPSGQLLEMIDDYGNTQVWSYFKDRLYRITDTGTNRYIEIAWGADGRISDITDHTGRTVHYTYSADTLTAVANPLQQSTRYGYTPGKYGPLLNTVHDHWNRNITTVSYDAQGRTTSYTSNGEAFTYTYNYQGNRNKTSKADSHGNLWVYTFGPDGLVTDSLPPGGGPVERRSYDGNGLIEVVTDPTGVKTRYTYDGRGNTLSVTNDYQGPTAVRWDYTYDSAFPDAVLSVIPRDPSTNAVHPHWQAQKYDYHPTGSTAPGALHHIYDVESDGTTAHVRMTMAYDPHGRPLTMTDAGGNITTYTYDGNITTIEAPANNDSNVRPHTTWVSDNLGRTISETDALGYVKTFTWDALDRMVTATTPAPSASSSLVFMTTHYYDEFDSALQLLFRRTVDPNGKESKIGFDQYGRNLRKIEAGRVSENVYTNGLLTSQVDSNHNITTFDYDDHRRLQRTTHPDETSEEYTYYEDDKLAAKRDRANRVVAFTYDAHKRPKTTTYPGGATITSTYLGQKLMSVADTLTSPAETFTFGWDNRFRRTSEVQGSRGTVSTTYTADGRNVRTVSVAGGATTTYAYYPNGSVRTIEWSPLSGEFQYTYTLAGQVAATTFPNGQTRAYSYDRQGRMTDLVNAHPTTGTIAAFNYGYDFDPFGGQPTLLGLRTTMTASQPSLGLAAAVTRYGYDNRYYLDRVLYPAGAPYNGASSSWTYDDIGNRTSATENGATAVYLYNTFNGNPLNSTQMRGDGTSSYTYDARGNVQTRNGAGGNLLFSWDNADRLLAVAGSGNSSYTYDYTGRRTRKTVNGTPATYVYSGAHAIAENGPVPAEYLFGPDLDEPLAMRSGGAAYYYDLDGQGSVVALNDAAGVVQNAYAHDAWGTLRSSIAGIANPLGYTAREQAENGLQFYRARYYQPSSGRFLSEDPIRNPWASAYAYVGNVPTMFTDPTGAVSRRVTGPVYRPMAYEDDENHHDSRVFCGGFAYGCATIENGRVDCNCSGGCFNYKAHVSISGEIVVYYSDDIKIPPDKIKEEENKHVANFQRIIDNVVAAGSVLEKVSFQSKAACNVACFAFELWATSALNFWDPTHFVDPHPY